MIFLLSVNSFAQDAVSLRQAMELSLKNNYDLRIVRNNVKASALLDAPGVAGALPTATAGARDRESVTDIDQRFSNGTTISRNDVSSNAFNGDLTVSYTLFNGFRVQAERDRLSALLKEGEAGLVAQIQNTCADVTFRYFDVVRQSTFRKALENSRALSEKKLEIVDARTKAGLSNATDLYQARIDLNTSEQQLAEQDFLIRQARIELDRVLALSPDTVFALADTIVIDRSIDRDTVMRFIDSHPDLVAAAARTEMDQQSLRIIRSQRLPSLVLDGAYGYSRTENAAGFSLLNSFSGPSVGATLRIPLYNGNTIRIQEKVAMLQVDNARIAEERTRQTLIAQAVRSYEAYRTALAQLDNQEESFRMAGEVTSIQLIRFSQGLSTILDLRRAQADYEQTAASLVNARFVAKIAETELLRLMCRLGQQQ
ncbi:MAG: TolC family protein [Bacteroidota bacterium]